MKVALLYHQYLDKTGETETIGGIQTYIYYLSELIKKMGHNPLIIQFSENNFESKHNGATVLGYKPRNNRNKNNEIYKFSLSKIDKNKDLVIFCSENIATKTSNKRTITIQHGVYWDIPSNILTAKKLFQDGILSNLYKLFFLRKALKNIDKTNNIVCVDYNFYNFYRGVKNIAKDKYFWIVPNFCEKIIPHQDIRNRISSKNKQRIIFARRFQNIRGVKEIANVISSLYEKQYDFEFHFYGEGPYKTWLKNKFSGNNQVKIASYKSTDSYNIHLNYDIAIVPSVASEGTSLSLLESMAAGCIPLCSNVGGMTNIIIDNFNGFFFNPSLKDNLQIKLEEILKLETKEKESILHHSIETVRKGFSLEVWENKWETIINKF